jgi:hypothetical protein
MNIVSNTLPDDNIVDCNLYILDPLSTIIKLSILSNKPIGTKIYVSNNMIHIQEKGIFQSFCRFYNKANKTSLRFLYNPIQIACETFLNREYINKNNEIIKLFESAKKGLFCLTETYKNCSIIQLCLYYYIQLLSNFIDKHYNKTLFIKDGMTIHYSKTLTEKINNKWTDKQIKIILDLTHFLEGNHGALNNVKSLETMMVSIDEDFSKTNFTLYSTSTFFGGNNDSLSNEILNTKIQESKSNDNLINNEQNNNKSIENELIDDEFNQ